MKRNIAPGIFYGWMTCMVAGMGLQTFGQAKPDRGHGMYGHPPGLHTAGIHPPGIHTPGIHADGAIGFHRDRFPDLLDIRAGIADTGMVSRSFFSDQGAWHAYGLPGSEKEYGGFTGPLLMGMEGKWLSGSIAKLDIWENRTRVLLATAGAEMHYFPGLLQADYKVEGLAIRQQLIFVSSREAMVRTIVRNVSGTEKEIGFSFSGEVLLSKLRIDAEEQGVVFVLGEGKGRFIIRYDHRPSKLVVQAGSYEAHFPPVKLKPGGQISMVQSQYYFPWEDQPESGRLSSGQSSEGPSLWSQSLRNQSPRSQLPGNQSSLRPSSQDQVSRERASRELSSAGRLSAGSSNADRSNADRSNADRLNKEQHPDTQLFETMLQANTVRWNRYLAAALAHIDGARLLPEDASGQDKLEAARRLAVKSLITLLTNWRSAAGDLLHDGVFPSVSYQGFYGVWSWDSWKQAVALACFAPSLAKDNIRCLFDYQDSAGMVPDCVYMDKRENNWRDTKPPLAAWAVWKVFERTGDRAFLRELYPALVRYHRWWYQNRDHDGNGLCEYGSTDGTRIAAAWESGMDNAVRFDSAKMTQNTGSAWSLDQESVDLNAYLYAEKLYLARIAEALAGKKGRQGSGQRAGRGGDNGSSGKESRVSVQREQGAMGSVTDAVSWREEAKKLRTLIEQRFYNAERGYYYDYHLGLQRLIPVDGPEGWIPLWAGIADSVRAARVLGVMEDTARFNTYVPLPTLAANHPDFNPANGYWRGPVWLDQFYYGVEGLRRYGYKKEADRFIRQLFAHAEGLAGQGPIRENYHPLTGQGLNALNFSWSAAFVLLMLSEHAVRSNWK